MKLLPTYKPKICFDIQMLVPILRKNAIDKLCSLSHLLLNVMWIIFNESSYIYGTLISEKELQTMLLHTLENCELA